MAEIENPEVVETKKSRFSKRIKDKYPDKQFDDDEALFGQISDDYDDYDNQIKGYKEREGALTNMFDKDPRSARFLSSWKNGGDPAVELIRQYGDDIREALDDPERQEEIAKANKEFVERVAKEKELDETYQKNLQSSLEMISKYQEEKGYTDEQIDKSMEFVMNIVKDAVMGKFSEETLDMATKALNYDNDVANASYEGEVRGKNSKIDMQLKSQKKGDGIPSLGGRNNESGAKPQRQSIFSLAQEAR